MNLVKEGVEDSTDKSSTLVRALQSIVSTVSFYSMNLFNHFIFQDLLKAAIPELNGSIKKGEQFAADYKN